MEEERESRAEIPNDGPPVVTWSMREDYGGEEVDGGVIAKV